MLTPKFPGKYLSHLEASTVRGGGRFPSAPDVLWRAQRSSPDFKHESSWIALQKKPRVAFGEVSFLVSNEPLAVLRLNFANPYTVLDALNHKNLLQRGGNQYMC